mmetsp:Transcript_5676/g.17517  ORF Transcript_5676/g.17517 Transcript_5676/m.17517 type:complete len:234 (-) Transcript_5676:526-1227(-)
MKAKSPCRRFWNSSGVSAQSNFSPGKKPPSCAMLEMITGTSLRPIARACSTGSRTMSPSTTASPGNRNPSRCRGKSKRLSWSQDGFSAVPTPWSEPFGSAHQSFPRRLIDSLRKHAMTSTSVRFTHPAASTMRACCLRWTAAGIDMLGDPDNDMAREKSPAESGDASKDNTLVPPLLWPKIITRAGSPPKARAFRWTHCKDSSMSRKPKPPVLRVGDSASMASMERKPARFRR